MNKITVFLFLIFSFGVSQAQFMNESPIKATSFPKVAFDNSIITTSDNLVKQENKKNLTNTSKAVSSSSTFAAQEDKAPQHKGFLARGQIGLGVLSYEGLVFPFLLESERDAIPAGHLNVDLGYSFSRNWSAHIGLGSTGGQFRYITTTKDAFYRVTWLGLGGSYYFIPANIYIAPTFLSTNLNYDDEALEVNSNDAGSGFQLAIGKEWKISNQWGIGVAMIYTGFQWSDPKEYIQVVEDNFNADVNEVEASIFTIAFTATFN